MYFLHVEDITEFTYFHTQHSYIESTHKLTWCWANIKELDDSKFYRRIKTPLHIHGELWYKGDIQEESRHNYVHHVFVTHNQIHILVIKKKMIFKDNSNMTAIILYVPFNSLMFVIKIHIII